MTRFISERYDAVAASDRAAQRGATEQLRRLTTRI
jgi:hypothetical protein